MYRTGVDASLRALAKALTRSAVLDDLRLVMGSARFAGRLLWVAARDRRERAVAEDLCVAIEHIHAALRRLG